MRILAVVSTLVAVATARPGLLQVAPLVTVPISHLYHAQDNLGQYTYGYTAPFSAKIESRSADGVTSGGYSYVDAEGQVQSVQYVADSVHGFQVAATNLPLASAEPPKPVEDTPEVASARAEHLAAVEAVKSRDSSDASASETAEDDGQYRDASASETAEDDGQYREDKDSVEVGATPVVQYLQYINPIQGVVPVVSPGLQYYSYAVSPAVVNSVVYTNGHQVSDLPADDAAVSKAKKEHAAAHQEVKTRLADAGVAVQ